MSTARECGWTAQPDGGWLTIRTGASGQGEGTVEYEAAANPDPVTRRGAIVLNGQRVEIGQGPAPCEFSTSLDHISIGPGGGTTRVEVSASSPLCSWTASSPVEWIAIRAGGSGTGHGAVELIVEETAGTARSADVIIAGRVVRIAQDARPSAPPTPTPPPPAPPAPPPAPPAPPPTPPTPPPAPPTPPPDPPTPPPAPPPAPPAPPPGPPTPPPAPPAPPSSPTPPPGCELALDPASVVVNHHEHEGTVTVTAGDGCAWTAVSRDDWIAIVSGASGTGNGQVRYTIERLPGGSESERTGRIAVGDQTVTVTQRRGSTGN